MNIILQQGNTETSAARKRTQSDLTWDGAEEKISMYK